MAYAEGSGVGASWFRRWRRAIFVTIGVLFAAWVATGFYATWYHGNEKKTAEAVAYIQAQKITMDDVDGKHLPPAPDPKLVDATVEGVDANNNGIRDDVELAIFKKYPNSPYTRSAELQYAMAQQMYLTRVFDSETWKAVAELGGRASLCLNRFARDESISRRQEVEELVFNSSARQQQRDKAFEFITSHGSADGEYCDVNM